MNVVIFTGGVVGKGYFVTNAINSADFIIAADSGAKDSLAFGIIPKIVIGDFDSLDKKTKEILEKKGTEFIKYPTNKNETDTELAVNFAIKKGATKISILGGMMGGRLDHVVGN